MVERTKFVGDHATGIYRISELAKQYGISRKTAYKWLQRFEEEGPAGLVGRPPVADEIWNRTPPGVEEHLVTFRRQHPAWGPRKMLDVLAGRHPRVPWPAASTVAAILKRNGLV